MDEYAIVIDIVTEIIEEDPPLLFDLNALQIEANRLLGLSAAETLRCAQKLYEAELLTYPRTASRYITSDMEQSVSILVSGTESTTSSTGPGTESNGVKDYKMESGDKEFVSGVSELPDVSEVKSQNSDPLESLSKSEISDDVKIHNSEQTNSGVKLVGEQRSVNEYFRGDCFSEKDSYENSVDKSKIADLIKANAATTCKLNYNLDGGLNSNKIASSKMSDEERADVKKLEEMRKNVPKITKDTVMQKVISKEQLLEYIRSDDPKIHVSGCASKASDVAPYTNNIQQAYKTLRLDYNGTPYKELAENKGDMYVMRFLSDYCPTNSSYPKMDGSQPWNKPPCTGTGYTGSKDHLIPEYTYGRGQEISDGAIYKVDDNGQETLVAYWNHGRFEKVE